MLVAVAVAALVVAPASFGLGVLAGRRLLWHQMRSKREFGLACLDQLAQLHGGRVELHEPPAG